MLRINGHGRLEQPGKLLGDKRLQARPGSPMALIMPAGGLQDARGGVAGARLQRHGLGDVRRDGRVVKHVGSSASASSKSSMVPEQLMSG